MSVKNFLKQLIFIGIFLLIVFIVVYLWLKMYTNHGQKIAMGDYIGMQVDEAEQLAKESTFEIVVIDSVHVVGKAGGEIISQNPVAGSEVKEKRKVYLTITKYDPDKILVKNLPRLYGTDYYTKCKDLGYQNINCEIKGYKYDSGAKDYILEAYYNGELIISASGRNGNVEIEKGGTIAFILSKPEGGTFSIPELRCMPYSRAKFIVEELKFQVGNVTTNGDITDPDNAYVVEQNPNPLTGGTIAVGDFIDIVIQQSKPSNCQ